MAHNLLINITYKEQILQRYKDVKPRKLILIHFSTTTERPLNIKTSNILFELTISIM